MRVCYRTTETSFRPYLQYEVCDLDLITMKQTFVHFSQEPECDIFFNVRCVRELPMLDCGTLSNTEWRWCNLKSNPHFERVLQVAIAGKHSTVLYNPETFANEAYNSYVLLESFVPTQLTLKSIHAGIRPEQADIHIDFRPYVQMTHEDIDKVFHVKPLTSKQIHSRLLEFQRFNLARCKATATIKRGLMQHNRLCEDLLETARKRLFLSQDVEQSIWRVAETITLLENSSIITCEHIAEAIQYSKLAIVFE